MNLEQLVETWSVIVVRMSLVVAAGAMAVLLVERAWPRLSSAWRHRLWLAVSLQGLLWCSIPITLPSQGSLADKSPAIADESASATEFVTSTPAAPSLSGEWLLTQAQVIASVPAHVGAWPKADAMLLFGAWLAGACGVGLAMLAWQCAFHARLRRLSAPAEAGVREACERQARLLGMRQAIAVRVSPAVQVPLVSGLLRPEIYLPQRLVGQLAADRGRQAELEAMLAHELAHLRRRDPLWAALALASVALNFFNPLAWLASRRLAVAREECVDAEVLAAGHAPAVYARALLRVAESLTAPALPTPGLALGNGASLRDRITAILSVRTTGSQAPGWLLAGVLAVVGVASLVSFRPALAADQPLADKLIAVETPAQIARTAGLKFLAAAQQADGSFTDDLGGSVGAVALAGLAFVSSETPAAAGPFAANVNLCRDFILKQAAGDGYLARSADGKPGSMYDHGFATQFLARLMLREKQRPAVKAPFDKAVAIILKAQGVDGGWRYAPAPQPGGDVTVTACQLAALAAAREAGADIPRESIAKAVGFIQSCQRPDGGYEYTAGGTGTSGFARSAAAAATLRAAGVQPPVLNRDYLEKFLPTPERERATFELYGLSYAASFFAAEPQQPREAWHAAVTRTLRAQQTKEGSWNEGSSTLLGTALGVLALDVRAPAQAKDAPPKEAR